MKSLFTFMDSGLGRVSRILLGLVLIYAGLGVVGGTAGLVVAIVGLVPIVMGVWGHCLFETVAKKAHLA